MSIRLIFTNNSVKNTTLGCDSLGIHYEVSKSKDDGIVSVARWDWHTDQSVTIGQFRLPLFSKDQIKLARDTKLYTQYSSRSFEADNGAVYRWKLKREGINANHVLYYDDEMDGSDPLVKYCRHYRTSNEPSYLEILDSSVMDSLDLIVVTFLIMEKKKRDRDKSSGGN
ncbi:5461_t:CDS:2 [Acaulospora colombiana]|uniref:5461_t:CDS:1 n=1 Tax=Acaulospora colombiana TaxID=27376 RepID=A0ACA9P4T7_9GLOM|nr:5461_t:CDS:2 [Acaulospora colombiana]